MGTVSGWAMHEGQKLGCLPASAKAPSLTPGISLLHGGRWGGLPQGHTANWGQARVEWM